MTGTEASYYDGRVSTCHRVRLSLTDTGLRLEGDGIDLIHPVSDVRVAAGVGTVRRRIRLPGGGVCELDDEAFAAALEQRQGAGRAGRIIHRWERSLPLALGALAITGLLVFLFLRFGVPGLARRVAFALPPRVEDSLGSQTLSALDGLVFAPTRLPAARQQDLTRLFRRITARIPGTGSCRLVFRDSPALGANALALPGGTVVLTDGLAELAKNDNELAGVLAHELGHILGRHGLRHALQNSATTLVMAALTGDILSVTSFSATLPTTLVDASFSRDFEREADATAILYLQQAGIPLRSYAEILARLQAQLDTRHGATPAGEKRFRNYLSTHPDTGERIRDILAAERVTGGEK